MNATSNQTVGIDELIRQMNSIRRKVRQLGKEVEYLRKTFVDDSAPVANLLKTRGIRLSKMNPTDQLFFPSDLSQAFKNRFYEMMTRYSFRLLLRDIIKRQQRFKVQDLTHYCSQKVASRYCRILSEMGILVRTEDGSFRTAVSPLYSFGQTLEWFVAEMLKREFASPAVYRAVVKGIPSGGDFDVIASWQNRLVYVEVKSSPPSGIEQNEISTFFAHVGELLPDIAILFEDTQLRMKDKLVVLFERELEKRFGKESRTICPVERLKREIFCVNDRIFIVNSKRDVAENFSLCLKHYLSHGVQKPLPLGPF